MARRSSVTLGAVVLVLLSFAWYKWNLAPVDAKNEVGIIVQVPKGSSSASIAQILEEKGLVRSSFAFRLYTRLHGLQSGLKAGSVFIKPSMGVPEIADVLVKGFSDQAVITIPEGTTVAGLEKILVGKQLLKEGELVNCARTCSFSEFDFLPTDPRLINGPGGRIEGYLFPDTYFIVRETFTAQEFLSRLIATFEDRVAIKLKGEIEASGHSLHEIVTMASLIEEETRTDDERPIVSGILWKRPENGMRLDVDAAVRYILGKSNEALRQSDLDTNSPYNLRKASGLPPGPIANPGLESIQAALYPKESPYFYYLHDRAGEIHYAKTNDEHNENKAKYLQ